MKYKINNKWSAILLTILRCCQHKIRILLLCFSALFALTACDGIFSSLFEDEDEEVVICDADVTAVTFKKVAYWDGDDTENMDDADYNQLTHLIYGYLAVNADGSLVDFDADEEDDFEDMIASAQAEGVKVAISIGGEGDDSQLNSIAGTSSVTNTLVDNIIDFLEQYDLDGVDLNWQTPENDDEGELFEDLVEALSDALRADGYFFSISVISGVDDDQVMGDVIDNTVFDYVDFVNVRAFDTTDNDDLHSSEQDAIDAIDYWTGRCLIKNKLVLGIPLYSRGDSVESYDEIVDDNTDHACTDESKGSNYNGIPTVVAKTEYAMNHAGGVMIQSLEQDAYENSDYLLLNVIDKTQAGNTVSICD